MRVASMKIIEVRDVGVLAQAVIGIISNGSLIYFQNDRDLKPYNDEVRSK
jgi:hypothetical protein